MDQDQDLTHIKEDWGCDQSGGRAAVQKEEEHLSRVWNRTLGRTSTSFTSPFQLHRTSSADKPTIHPEFCFSRSLTNKGGAKADQNPLQVQANMTGHNANIPKKRTKKLKKDLTGKDVRSRRKQRHCSECEKMFAFTSCLKRHMRSHTGVKPFSCSECGTSFTQKSSLRSHMRVHTGEQPFRCAICQRCFRHKSNFKTHLLTHTGEKPFGCSVCGRRFSIKSSLDVYMRVHTGEKPFSCSVCHKRFGHKMLYRYTRKSMNDRRHVDLYSTEDTPGPVWNLFLNKNQLFLVPWPKCCTGL